MAEHILCQVRDAVMHLEIKRREKKNALTRPMYEALSEALRQAEANDGVGAILLRGQADLFTAGNEVADFLARQPNEVSAAMRFIEVLAAVGKPVVAAVGGLAVGIGSTMLLHCDLVYAADNASFKLPFVALGLCPEAGSSLLLPRLAGHQRAAELLFFGEAFSARQARDIGLVNAVLAPSELMTTAEARAQTLARLPRQALATTKALLKRAGKQDFAAAMSAEIKHFGELAASPMAQEIFRAFLEKRSPDLSGLADK